ncbi:MAG: hypothetical protein MR364_08790 [Oscillospiraceae bacterium]|nr:hypothetical protein [Oscillospiraceae bacterium]
MSNFKWMPLACLNMSATNLAAAEKLRRFGFVVNCSEFGSEKYTKASLGIYDVLAKKEKPNILIISNSSSLYSWYRVLVTSIGADFKIITGVSEPLVYFNEQAAGLYLISTDTLFKDNVLKKKLSRRFLWDLVIIDEEANTEVPDYVKYKEYFTWTAERLMINTPIPAKSIDDKIALTELIKSVLDNSEDVDDDAIRFDSDSARLNEELPVMRYFDKSVYTGEAKRNVRFVDYGFSDEAMANLRRRVDLRSGLPAYRYGGNVFEEYDCEKYEKEKKIYLKQFFVRSDVEDLRAFDRKLDSLLKLCDEVLAESGSRMIIYCCDKNTLDYLNKVLLCIYGSEVYVAREELIHKGEITRSLSANSVTALPRILLGTDDLGSAGEGIRSVTCVVNYELPLSPVLLERRMTRHGCANESQRQFVIFRDSNKVFDSCVLNKVLYLRLENAFCGTLPARSILLDIPEKAECMKGLIADLKYTRDFARQVDNCLDLIKKVKCEYTIPETEKIGTGKQLAEFADAMLGKLYKLLGLSEQSTDNEIESVMNLLGGLCVVNDGKLEKAPDIDSMVASFEDSSYTNLPFAMEAVKGLMDAKAEIDEFHKGENFHLMIKQEISSLGDCIQYPVLYGIWKYRAKEQDSNRSFKDYIKIYNDGI